MRTLDDNTQGCLCTVEINGKVDKVLWSNPAYFMHKGMDFGQNAGFDMHILAVYTGERYRQQWKLRGYQCQIYAQKTAENRWFCFYQRMPVQEESVIDELAAEEPVTGDSVKKGFATPEDSVWQLLHIMSQFRNYDSQDTADNFRAMKDMNNRMANMQREQLQEALERVRRADQAKTEFFSRMSHELRTPMNGILGMAELSSGEEDVQVLLSNMQRIKEAGNYMAELINDTLDFQKMESGKMELRLEAVHMGSIMEELISMITPNVNLRHQIFLVENANLDMEQYIMADAVRLKQIFANILMNAVKFTPDGGTIRFTMECLGCEGAEINVRFQIVDSGIGMSEDFVKERLFKGYEQEDGGMTSQYAGSGLGLAITRKLVEMMKGRIYAESEQGVGSCFTIDLTLQTVDAPGEAQRNNSDDYGSMMKGKHILLCEDHPLNAEIMIALLQKAGGQVEHAENGKIGVELYQKSEPFYYDIILMDMRMPVMDGLTATRTIRQMQRQDAESVPVIAVTANAYDTDREQMLEAGVDAHLVKPINVRELYETIAKYDTSLSK